MSFPDEDQVAEVFLGPALDGRVTIESDAIDVETDLEGALVRSTLRGEGVLLRGLEFEKGAPLVSRTGKPLTDLYEPPGGWTYGGLAEKVTALAERVEAEAMQCSCDDLIAWIKGRAICSGCLSPIPAPTKCPECDSDMESRTTGEGVQFWGCSSYPDCTKALLWDGSSPKPVPSGIEAKRLLAARSLLDHDLIKGPASIAKLRSLLDTDPDRVLPLILGKETPSGRPTIESIYRARRAKQGKGGGSGPKRRRRAKKLGKRALPEDPLKGIRLYREDEKPRDNFTLTVIPPEGGPTKPAKLYPHHELPHDELNPVQSAALPWVTKNVNVVVATSTGTGKTMTAEMFMGDALDRDGQAIFLSPLRAVSQEKYDEWSEEDHPFAEQGVSICTGDYSLTEAKKRELRQNGVIVMTSEMLDSKTRRIKNEGNVWLLRTMCMVVDEAHLLTMEGRGTALECGLMRFTKQNPHARIVLLSATMPNVEQLGKWLSRLNGKPTVVIRSDWRPIPLDVNWVLYSGRGSYHQRERKKLDLALSLIAQHHKDKWIVFVHSKKVGRKLLEEIRDSLRMSAEFHSADLDRAKRARLESNFRYGDLQVCIATSTLAYGINMPARRVLVVGIHRGMQEVDPIDIKQEVGRAGRKGLDEKGDAYVLIPDSGIPGDAQATIRRYQTINPITSKLNDLDTLGFHLTAEIAEGEVRTVKDAGRWHARSFASYQGRPLQEGGRFLSPEGVIERLSSAGIIKEAAAPGSFEATMLGRVSSWLYFSPFDVSDWHRNFSRLMEQDRLYDDDALAWALGNVKTAYDSHWLPKEAEPTSREIESKLRSISIPFGRLSPAVVGFRLLIEGANFKPMVSVMRALQSDSDRITQAIEMIDRHVIRGLGEKYCTLMGMRVKYGCSWKEAQLCRLPGIGAKRARTLIEEGIESVGDVLRDKPAVVRALGQRTALVAIRGAKALLREKQIARRKALQQR